LKTSLTKRRNKDQNRSGPGKTSYQKMGKNCPVGGGGSENMRTKVGICRGKTKGEIGPGKVLKPHP